MKKIDWLNHFINFLAVILGVFLAFWVSTRSERLKEKRELREIVVSLIGDLHSDQNTYQNYQIPQNIRQKEDLIKLIAGIRNSQTDSILAYFSSAMQIENYSPVSSTFLFVSSSGKINLIDDIEVRKGLSNYYDALAVEAQKKGEVQVNFFLEEMIPWMTDHVDLIDTDPTQLAGEVAFANKLILFQNFIENKVEQYQEINEVAQVLEEELNKMLK